ncbi:MAG: peptide chain release factor 1 [Dehalococcoidia bacterium]|nr:peptide chain release factor 1 [Dehalococcoidia bacterium]
MEPAVRAQLEALTKRFNELMELMALPEVAGDHARLQQLNKERASLAPIVALYREHRQALQELDQAQELVRSEADGELREMARAEVSRLTRQQGSLEERLRLELVPRDPKDEGNVFIEVRAGTGGEEAALFAVELLRMYLRYAQRKGWKTDIADQSLTGLGGVKEVTFEVRGRGAYSRLKHESGVHRVQRVPSTESSGRIHTSTATVAVLPEVEEVDVHIAPEDVKVDIFHAGGHGGQNVQKVATAVRLTHLPTGIVVVCRDERSQLQNRVKAMNVLRSRVYQQAVQQQQDQLATERRAQVGTGERSEKIRTYNFPQDRVTDHRVNLTVHNLPHVLDGGLDELLGAVIADAQHRQLEETLAAGPLASSR